MKKKDKDELNKQLKQLSGRIYEKRVSNLVHPFKLPMVNQVNNSQIRLLKQWALTVDLTSKSVMESVDNSVGEVEKDLVWNLEDNLVIEPVDDLTWESQWDSKGNSLWDLKDESVWDAEWGYFGSMFKLKRSEWKYTDKIKCKGYPFQSLVKLWEQGLVPSFDGTIWRLHSGKKAKVVFEIKRKDLKN